MAKKVCPVWVGYILANPVRKLFQNPKKILGPYVEEDMIVLDIGCAMGFFSLPLGQMVGPNGKVICVDVQEKMIEVLKKRALKAGVYDRIEARICKQNSLCLNDFVEKIDFALAFAVVHELPDAFAFFSEIYKAIKSGARFLVAEPKYGVSEKDFKKTVSIAVQNDFKVIDRPKVGQTRVVLLRKK